MFLQGLADMLQCASCKFCVLSPLASFFLQSNMTLFGIKTEHYKEYPAPGISFLVPRHVKSRYSCYASESRCQHSMLYSWMCWWCIAYCTGTPVFIHSVGWHPVVWCEKTPAPVHINSYNDFYEKMVQKRFWCRKDSGGNMGHMWILNL